MKGSVMATIIPSIASANPLKIAEELDRLGPVERLHVDIEDGNFVPNITFGLQTLQRIAMYVNAMLDVHLLVTDPYPYIEACAACNVRDLSAHYEAMPYPMDFCRKVRNAGMRCGLALNFKTPAEALAPFADVVDYTLVMTAEPDDQGQRFVPAMLEKVRRVRAILPNAARVWGDGGIGVSELTDVVQAGADTVILGRAVWGAPDPASRLRELYRVLEPASLPHLPQGASTGIL